jgi:hypothetical protein
MASKVWLRAGLAVGTAGLLMGLFAAQVSAPAGATERHALYVSPSAQANNRDRSCQSARYTTIGAAVTAAPAWGTVVVCPGTYHEQVVLSKPLTVTGRGATVDETGVKPTLVVSPPHIGPTPIFAGVVITSSNVHFSGFTVTNALGEGILAAGVNGTIYADAITSNVVEHNDLGGGVPPATPYFECQPMQEGTALIPNDCGEGIHLLAVADSSVVGNRSQHNSGGILLTDETGPTHGNVIAYNTVTDNTADCGITVPGHNPNALSPTGKPQPSVAGVYDNSIIRNVVADNGVAGEGAGVLFANAGPGTGSYDNLVANNFIVGNGLSGVTMHAHTLPPGMFEDLSGNQIVNNVIGTNNLDGDSLDSAPPPAPPTGPRDLEHTGVLVFSGTVPVSVTIRSNIIYDNHFGIWTSAVVTSSGLRSNRFFDVDVPKSLTN